MGNKASGSNGNNPPPSESENNDEDYVEELDTPQQRMRAGSSSTTSNSGKSPSYYTLIKNSYQALVNAIIRPPRSSYDVSQLGPPKFKFCGRTIQRTDFTLTSPRNLKFACSLWEPVDADRPSPFLPCVIYMHGNSSSRLEGLSALSVVLTLGATLLAFDFCGSGLSEGEYVSLGAFEKEDLQTVIQHLRDGGKTSTIALWGRSMGAATALLHAERDPSIAAMVLDSAFADLVMLAEEMVEKGRQQGLFAPSILVKIAIKFVRSSVQKAAGFDIKTLSPIEHADKCFIPALFIAAEDDNFVMPSHSQTIFDKYGGDKNIMIVEGDHNTPRPRYLFDAINIFLQSTLQIPDSWILAEGHEYTRRLPWTYRPPHSASSSGYNPSMYGKLSIDELLALQMMEEMGGPNIDEQSEQAMQRGVKEQLYSFLSGGGDLSSRKDPASNTSDKVGGGGTVARPTSLPPTPSKGSSSSSSKSNSVPPPAPPQAVGLLEDPETNEKCPSEMTTVARKYSKSSGDMQAINTRRASRSTSLETSSSSTTATATATASATTSNSHSTTWTCNTCTLINSVKHDICEACGLLRC